MSKKRTMSAGKRKRATKKTTKGRGRPPGAKTRKNLQADAEPSRCPRCQSTERKQYFGTRTLNSSGLIDGKPFNKIVYRRTACKACGQHRVDRSHEFDPELEIG